MPCISCGRGFHEECYTDCKHCHPVSEIEESLKGPGNPKWVVKDPEDVQDPHSTGRKRAAFLYPLFKDQPCEWRGKKNCGGGLNPIVGCLNGKQQHRHHGPVKNTLRNENGNVHRICSSCHNRWHAKNDEVYDEQRYNELPHAPKPASEMELLANEALYRVGNRK